MLQSGRFSSGQLGTLTSMPPYNSKYRYWTGLLLLVREVLYITASVTVSRDPQTLLLATNVLVGVMFSLSKFADTKIYSYIGVGR